MCQIRRIAHRAAVALGPVLAVALAACGGGSFSEHNPIAPTPVTSSRVALTGTVTDQATAAPLADATVTILDGPRLCAQRRLDRRDALILLGLVVFALVFRLWRLDLPRSQHFDEAYHARSAAEFLSDWEHGWHRDVYEWTHPMLAKYLIAGGIVLADPNKVVGTLPLDAPSPFLAVAPRRESSGYDRSIAFTGDGGSTIVAADAETGDAVVSWTAGGVPVKSRSSPANAAPTGSSIW